MRVRSYLALSAAAIVVIAGTPALAQTSANAETGDLGEIIVTAQKREQRLIDVPMAVSVLSGDDLKQRGIESVQDLSFSVPGLSMREDGPGSYTIFLRGLANQSGGGALVTQYLDEAPLSVSGYDQLSPVALDFARVEVLKGPQGTLYGQGSAGGTIRYITNDPKLDRIEGQVEGEVFGVSQGNAGWKATGVFNLPIVDGKLGLRVAAYYGEGGGWIDQPEAGIRNGNGTELLNLRAKLLWSPSDAFSAKAMVQIHRADTQLGLGYEEADRTTEVAIDPAKILIPKQFDYTLYNLGLRYDLGFADLVSATTYIDHKHKYPFSYTARPGNFSFDVGVSGNDERFVDAYQFSQELRLSSSGKPLEWTIGAYYSQNRRTNLIYYDYSYLGDVYTNNYYFSNETSKSISLFADTSYHLTDRLTVGAGVRYFEDKQTSLTERVPATGMAQSGKFHSIDPRVSISYKYNDHGGIYASVAKGLRSGGFNEAPAAPYGPEKIWTYELGSKGSFAEGAVQYELAAFYTLYNDMVRRRLVDIGGVLVGEASNIGRVEVKGLEAGLAVRPVPPLTISSTMAYLDSKIASTDAGDLVNIAGDPTDYTPELSFTLGANLDFDWSADMPGFFRVDFNFRDRVTYIDRGSFRPEVLPQKSDSLALLGARMGGRFNGFDVEVYALNLTNQNKSIDPYQGWANANRTRPRTIGLKIGRKF